MLLHAFKLTKKAVAIAVGTIAIITLVIFGSNHKRHHNYSRSTPKTTASQTDSNPNPKDKKHQSYDYDNSNYNDQNTISTKQILKNLPINAYCDGIVTEASEDDENQVAQFRHVI